MPDLVEIFCSGEAECQARPWSVPTSAVPALLYWSMGNSCGAYWLMTWANQYAPASTVSFYTVLQPVFATILTALLLATGCDAFGEGCRHLAMPSGETLLGILPIAAALALVVCEGHAGLSRAGRDRV